MLNYEEELKKFTPCTDIEDVEDAVYSQNMTDVIDLLKEMDNSRRPAGRKAAPQQNKESER